MPGDPIGSDDGASVEWEVWQRFDYGRARASTVDLTPSLEMPAFLQEVDKILDEYQVAQDAAECASQVTALGCNKFMDEFAVRAVRKSLDSTVDGAQARTAALFALLFTRKGISGDQLMRAFEKFGLTLEDLTLDVPQAPQELLRFIDCAICDGMLDQDYLVRLPEKVLQAFIASQGDQEHVARLQPFLAEVRAYKAEADKVIADLLNGAPSEEVGSVLKGLGDLHHEFVRRACIAAFARGERERGNVAAVLGRLRVAGVISADQVSSGLTRLVADLDDLKLDAPQAETHVIKFWVFAVREELLEPAHLTAAHRLRIGGKKGKALLGQVQTMVQDPLLSVEDLFADEVAMQRRVEEDKARKAELMTNIQEYFDSEDMVEFGRLMAAKELTPAHRCEVVRKLITSAMDRSPKQCHASVDLIRALLKNDTVRSADVGLALQHLRDQLPELVLDVPDAKPMLDAFVEQLGPR